MPAAHSDLVHRPQRRSTRAAPSRAMRERGTTRSKPAASARSRTSGCTWAKKPRLRAPCSSPPARRLEELDAVDRVGREVDDEHVDARDLARASLGPVSVDLVAGGLERRLDLRAEQQVGDERDDAGHHYCAVQPAELLAHGLRPPPHRGTTSTRPLRTSRTASSPSMPGVVEQLQRAVDRRRRGGVAEAVGDEDAPVPVVLGVGLRVAGDEVTRGLDVARSSKIRRSSSRSVQSSGSESTICWKVSARPIAPEGQGASRGRADARPAGRRSAR